MRYRRLDENHDYSFGRGKGDYLKDSVGNPEAVAQAIKTRLLLFTGEWWENLRDGLPLWQRILGSRIKDKGVVDRILLDRIKGLRLPEDKGEAITEIVRTESRYLENTRDYIFQCEVDTVFGKLYVTNKDQGTML